jgi:YVTN family beta-propeller protein
VSNGSVLCAAGWSVCAPGDPALQEVTYQDALGFGGCFAYDAAQDNYACQACTGTAAADDMAGMGSACGFKQGNAGSCIPGGRVDTVCCADYASGTACQFKPGLTTGAVCCHTPASTTSTTTGTTASSTSTTSTTTTSSTTTTTEPAACTTAADCDDGDPCNGVEGCVGGRCLAPRGVGGTTCPAGDPIAVVSRFRANAVAFCNTRTRTVETSVAVGKSPWGIAWQPDGRRVFVTNRDSDTVSVLDAVARTVVGTVSVDGQPLGVAVHPFLPRAYVSSYDEDTVNVVDTASLAVVARIKVGRGPSGIAVHPAGARVYVANYVEGTVSVIDAATNVVVGTVPTPPLPVGIAVHPAGTKVYVACLKDRQLAVVGTVSDSVLRIVQVGRRPIGVAFEPGGARAYVTNSADATVTVLDADADRVVAKVDVGKFPIGVAVAAGGGVWVADSRDGTMSVVGTGGTAASVPIADTPVAIGDFIGTPPDGCPRAPLPCDDANPFTGDACHAGVGCTQTAIPGPSGLHAGVAGIQTILADPGTADDPVVADVRSALPALESAVAAAETGGDRSALRLVRRTLKPILKTLERAKRHGTLGAAGARLLDIAREARRDLKRVAKANA